jgi:TRAP-type mannitol/chloroaromatic compound transport system permease small subunit
MSLKSGATGGGWQTQSPSGGPFAMEAAVRILNAVLRLIDNLNDWIGRALSVSVLLMFALVMIEVIRRYFFNSPTVWGNELTQLIFGAYVILSGGYILRFNGHVNVDVFYSHFTPKTKAILDIITFILFFLFCGMLLIYGGQLAWESLTTWERSQSAWNPPVYPFKLMIPLGALLLLLQGTAKLIRDIFILIPGATLTTEKSAEKETL